MTVIAIAVLFGYIQHQLVSHRRPSIPTKQTPRCAFYRIVQTNYERSPFPMIWPGFNMLMMLSNMLR